MNTCNIIQRKNSHRESQPAEDYFWRERIQRKHAQFLDPRDPEGLVGRRVAH